MDDVPDNAEKIPGYDGDYLITPDGVVYSTKWSGPRKMSTRQGRVCLWQNGKRYRPMVTTLIRRTFGGDQAKNDDLAAYVEQHYGDAEEVQDWIQEKLAQAS